jgi:hypothetical protein
MALKRELGGLSALKVSLGFFKLGFQKGQMGGELSGCWVTPAGKNVFKKRCLNRAKVNQHPPLHHPLDYPYYLLVDESQLS